MTFKMVDCNQWFARSHRQRLGGNQPDHDPANKTRASGRRDGINVVKLKPGIGQGGLHEGCHKFDMRARRNLGDDAAKGTVMVLLSGQRMAQDCPVGTHYCRCGFVAA